MINIYRTLEQTYINSEETRKCEQYLLSNLSSIIQECKENPEIDGIKKTWSFSIESKYQPILIVNAIFDNNSDSWYNGTMDNRKKRNILFGWNCIKTLIKLQSLYSQKDKIDIKLQLLDGK